MLAVQEPVAADVGYWRERAEAAEARCARLEADNAGLREDQARLRGENAELRGRLDRVCDQLATLQRMVFGTSSERGGDGGRAAGAGRRDGPGAGGPDHGGGDGEDQDGRPRRRGQRPGAPGPRRRDYSGLPTIEIEYDLPEGQGCCPDCGMAFTPFDEQVSEQVDWRVVLVRIVHRRHRYTRGCRCPGPRVITAPGPVKAIGKGRFTHLFLARLLVAKFLAGQAQHAITAGLARDGLDVPDSTLSGAMRAVGDLLEPLAAAIAARNAAAGRIHADETSWRVFATADGVQGSRKQWLWVFVAADTIVFIIADSRSRTVPATHLGIDLDAGTLTGDIDRHLVLSTDFFSAYQSIAAGVEAVTPLWCWVHIRRRFVRAGHAHPHDLGAWSRLWLDRIAALYRAHRAWATALRDGDQTAAATAGQAFEAALNVIDTARREQQAHPDLLHPAAAKVLATLDREWDGLVAHRDFPEEALDNNVSERALRTPVVGRKNFRGSGAPWAADLAARVWTITATIALAGLNPITYLTAYLDACGAGGGTPPTGTDLERFLPWTATDTDLTTWARPPHHTGDP